MVPAYRCSSIRSFWDDQVPALSAASASGAALRALVSAAGAPDPALAAIGEIIHDIDLKDGKYGREEAAGIRNVIAGIAASHNDDEQRLARGGAVLDDLYRYFTSRRGGK